MHTLADAPVRLLGDERAEVVALQIEQAETKRHGARVARSLRSPTFQVV